MSLLMRSTYQFLKVCFLLLCSEAALLPVKKMGGWIQADAPAVRPSIVNCTWKYFDQKIDHFGNTPGTFKQRYCIYDKYHKDAASAGFKAPAGKKGPIFFYCGNESPLEEYINNTGLMWELGKEMKALLVWVEHRYEPLSHPDLTGSTSPERCFAYCTTAQALADYVAVIKHLNPSGSGQLPVIGFGGSYGGMLAGWMRMKYPEVVDGAIAASAPIWQFATTVQRSTLDSPAVQISRGMTKAGGASDRCFSNLQVAWPLLLQAGQSSIGLKLLSQSVGSCQPLSDPRDLISWAQARYFDMAEGNYPFPSTYITYSVGPGYNPLPAWPMRVACSYVDKDFGIKIQGSPREVKYKSSLGKLYVNVDWADASGNGATLSESHLRESGVLDLAKAVADAAGVWYNVTRDQKCWRIPPHQDWEVSSAEGGVSSPAGRNTAPDADLTSSMAEESACPSCPPCDDCPPCGVSRCEKKIRQCSYGHELSKTFSWEGICTNDDLSQIAAHGLGRDIFWPPSKGQPDGYTNQILRTRNYTVESIVGPHRLQPGYNVQYDQKGLYGAPTKNDPWSSWLTAYYGGRNVSQHTNIVWSNGLLDPWSGMGVYPPGGGPDGPMIQNVSNDGSAFSLLIELGAHHVDLMFNDHRDPPCILQARAIEKKSIRIWCQQKYSRTEEVDIYTI